MTEKEAQALADTINQEPEWHASLFQTPFAWAVLAIFGEDGAEYRIYNEDMWAEVQAVVFDEMDGVEYDDLDEIALEIAEEEAVEEAAI